MSNYELLAAYYQALGEYEAGKASKCCGVDLFSASGLL